VKFNGRIENKAKKYQPQQLILLFQRFKIYQLSLNQNYLLGVVQAECKL